MTDKAPIVCKSARYVVLNDGNLSLGYGTILHPNSTLIIDGCNLTFGEYNIIEENVTIKVCPSYNASHEKYEKTEIYIGSFNHFRIGSYLQNTSVGNNCIINYKANLVDCIVGSNCIVSPYVELNNKNDIPNNQIIFKDYSLRENINFNKENHEKYIKELHALTEKKLKEDNNLVYKEI